MNRNKRVFVKAFTTEDAGPPCEGQGCTHDAAWRIGVPASVLHLCETCLVEMENTCQEIREGVA